MKRICFLLLFACSALARTFAQQKGITNLATDKKAVEATVLKMFAGMRAGDSAVVSSVLAPGARLLSVGAGPDGEVKTTETPFLKFLTAIGTPHAEVWDERISNGKAEVDGDLGTYWCQYAFYIGNKFSHCGVDALYLVRTRMGWQIFQVADTRRKTDCDPKLMPAKK